MNERPLRLGDVLDDYCTRCRLLLNHDVASMLSGAVAKVTCRTCLTTHDYRHAEVPARRKSKAKEKAALIEQVLSGMPGGSPPPPAVPPDATPPDAPPVRKKRDLWAEVNRIQQQNKK